MSWTGGLFDNNLDEGLKGSDIGNIITVASAEAADQCDCPGSGDFEINDGSTCEITTICDIGTNNFRLVSGNMRIRGTGAIHAAGCYIEDGEGMFVEDGAGFSCGR